MAGVASSHLCCGSFQKLAIHHVAAQRFLRMRSKYIQFDENCQPDDLSYTYDLMELFVPVAV
jgi:hypothetical protein